MKTKVCKCFLCLALVMSCTVGMVFSSVPTVLDNAFESLVEERESSAPTKQSAVQAEVHISDFTDVKASDWFYPYLSYLTQNGLIKGKTKTAFAPYDGFSYAECGTVIVRYLGLEDEAQRRCDEIAARNPELKNTWYSGSFEVLANLGIFDGYGLYKTENGIIVSVDKALADSPITRYRFAESISKSFELDSELKAENVYSEIGGSGREFIVGGGYNDGILSQYKALIKDYSEIPEESREDVLKAYYNGIFNGDVSGNFYPNNNLTRAEMAKVLAAVSDFSLRKRLIEEGYGKKVTEDMLHTDAFGVRTLRFYDAVEVLEKTAEGLAVDSTGITYTHSFFAPLGYAVDVYLYKKAEQDNTYSLEKQCTLHDYSSGEFAYDGNDARVLFVLRNVAEKSRTEGVLNVVISDGQIVSSAPMMREM